MSLQSAKRHLAAFQLEERVMEFAVSSATVALAAEALGTKPERIAKTLCFAKDDGCLLVVAAGDARVDNAKFKARFAEKAKMLPPEDVLLKTGHAVGGVCPFGVDASIPVYLDRSLARFETVFPACGSANSAIELDLDMLFRISGAREWVDVCKLPE